MRKIRMTIEELNFTADIILEEKNRELCDEIWNQLPFDSIQEHGMVSGELIYSWIPLVSEADVNFKLMYTESPVGCVTYSQGTGNKIIIKYGPCNEDLYAPVMGYIPEEYWKALAEVGKTVWFNYFHEKKLYVTHYSKLEE